jgi:hypothetical protein
MEDLAATIQLSAIKSLLIWRTVHTIAGFYMQRLHYERPDMGGSVLPGPALLSMFANLTGWVALLASGYVWYHLGWLPAVAYLVIPFVIAQLVELTEGFVFRFRTTVMALVCMPIGIAGFVMLVWSLFTL